MRLQTFSLRSGGYLSGTRLSMGLKQPCRQVVRCAPTISKTGHGTILIDRSQKPRASRVGLNPRDRGFEHSHSQVRRKWHVTSPTSQADKARPTTSKPCTPSGSRPNMPGQAQPGAVSDYAPSLVPNRAFPFIKHAGEQAALGLHKPIGLVLASAYLLGAVCQLSGIYWLNRFLFAIILHLN